MYCSNSSHGGIKVTQMRTRKAPKWDICMSYCFSLLSWDCWILKWVFLEIGLLGFRHKTGAFWLIWIWIFLIIKLWLLDIDLCFWDIELRLFGYSAWAFWFIRINLFVIELGLLDIDVGLFGTWSWIFSYIQLGLSDWYGSEVFRV